MVPGMKDFMYKDLEDEKNFLLKLSNFFKNFYRKILGVVEKHLGY